MLLVHPNPFTGPDHFPNTTTTTNNIGKAQGWPGGPGTFMDLKHQEPAEKACVPYAPLTFIVLFDPTLPEPLKYTHTHQN